ncbi:MAG: oligosaccharide flippase family protein [Propionivibrio sp.]|nr:oligosaccharide flippase family protein [Propionivibrio sp.]
MLRDFGIGSFLIQEKNLTESHIRSAFGISLAISTHFSWSFNSQHHLLSVFMMNHDFWKRYGSVP